MFTPTVLSIAGFDPYGGAGILADTKTVHALGGYAFSSVTAITAQNSQGVKATRPVSAESLKMQLETLLEDVKVDAVKIGMLSDASIIETVAEIVKRYRLRNVVLDPVILSSSGMPLLEPEAVEMMVVKLFPLCRLITPNLPETNRILGRKYRGDAKDITMMAEEMFAIGARNILFKGGHAPYEEAVDCLVERSGRTRFRTDRVETTHTHGTGCVLSSAIAVQLAKGDTLSSAVKTAKHFLYEKLRDADFLQFDYREKSKERTEAIF